MAALTPSGTKPVEGGKRSRAALPRSHCVSLAPEPSYTWEKNHVAGKEKGVGVKTKGWLDSGTGGCREDWAVTHSATLLALGFVWQRGHFGNLPRVCSIMLSRMTRSWACCR